MRIVRSYTNIWKVEKIFYGVNDLHLPRPVPMSTAVWFGFFLMASILLKGIPPFVFTDHVLMNHAALPILFTWLMGKMKLDGKTPQGFVKSVIFYMASPRTVVRGKEARVQDIRYTDILITVGKSIEKEGKRIAAVSD